MDDDFAADANDIVRSVEAKNYVFNIIDLLLEEDDPFSCEVLDNPPRIENGKFWGTYHDDWMTLTEDQKNDVFVELCNVFHKLFREGE